MPEFAPQKRVRNPFKSARAIKGRRADGMLLLEHAETVENPQVKALIIAAARSLGAKPPKKTLPAAPPESDALRMGSPPGGAAGDGAKVKKDPPEKPEFTPAIQGLLDSRPDLRDELLKIARLSQPATVRAGQMRGIIAANPRPPAPVTDPPAGSAPPATSPSSPPPAPAAPLPPAERPNPRMPVMPT